MTHITELADRLEGLAKEATQGEWQPWPGFANCHVYHDSILSEEQVGIAFASEPNTSYIAAANPQAVLALIAEFRQAYNAGWNAAVEAAAQIADDEDGHIAVLRVAFAIRALKKPDQPITEKTP